MLWMEATKDGMFSTMLFLFSFELILQSLPSWGANGLGPGWNHGGARPKSIFIYPCLEPNALTWKKKEPILNSNLKIM